MSAATETVGRAAQWVLKSNARCDQKWLNSGLQVRWIRHVGWRGRDSPSPCRLLSGEGALMY